MHHSCYLHKMTLKSNPIIGCYTQHLINPFIGKVCGSLNFQQKSDLGEILTTNSLQKRRLVVLDWSCMCKRDGENIDHLLFHCMVARKLCTMVFSWFGVPWVMPKVVVELLTSWKGKSSWFCNAENWRIIPHCLVWGVFDRKRMFGLLRVLKTWFFFFFFDNSILIMGEGKFEPWMYPWEKLEGVNQLNYKAFVKIG